MISKITRYIHIIKVDVRGWAGFLDRKVSYIVQVALELD